MFPDMGEATHTPTTKDTPMGNTPKLRRSRYTRLVDLYTKGTEYVIFEPGEVDDPEYADGLWCWVQRLTPADRDEVTTKALAAQSLLILALKDESSEERRDFVASYAMTKPEEMIQFMVARNEDERFRAAQQEVEADEEFRERYNTWMNASELAEVSPEEQAALEKVEAELLAEIKVRMQDSEEMAAQDLKTLYKQSPDLFFTRALDDYITYRGKQKALTEQEIQTAFYSLRACAADRVENKSEHTCTDACNHWDWEQCRDENGDPYINDVGDLVPADHEHNEKDGCRYIPEEEMPFTVSYTYNHDECENHKFKMFESAQDFRSLPDDLFAKLLSAVIVGRMTEYEAKK